MKRKIYLASDHGGFELKGELVTHLKENGYEAEDLGPFEYSPDDDYPDYVLSLVKKLRTDDMGLGILMCRSAQGVSIAANRNPGIRAAVVWNEAEAKKSKEHNDSNIICLSADNVDTATNMSIVDAWLQAQYTHEDRHARRLRKIENYFPV